MDKAQFTSEVVANARIGRSGWKARAQAEAERLWGAKVARKEEAARAARNAAAGRGWLIAVAQKETMLAAEKAEIDRKAETVGYGLRDVNPYFYNCGHYPEWVVVAGGKYASRHDAEAAMSRRNRRSCGDWLDFLNGGRS